MGKNKKEILASVRCERNKKTNERERIMVTVKLLPLVTFGLLLWVWICAIIGAATSNKGWAKGSNAFIGWKKGTVVILHNTDHHFTLDGSAETGGNAAVAGSIIAILVSVVVMALAIARTFGLGPRLLHFVGAGLCFLLAFIWMVCWATWADKTSDLRDKWDMNPDYAFAFAIMGNLFTLSAGFLLLLSRWKDCTIVSTSYSSYQ
ncbi:hypothetical protein QOT17_010209 [Balamuthia mandrillaris]